MKELKNLNINSLIERQKFINDKCGFKLDLDGLYLGFFAEVGELSSAIALYSGFKKPKPKDFEKFPNWETDLLKEISDEFADVLVYLLQLSILKAETDWSCDDKHFITREIEYMLNFDNRYFKFFNDKINHLNTVAHRLNIDLEKAYFDKTEKLIARFN